MDERKGFQSLYVIIDKKTILEIHVYGEVPPTIFAKYEFDETIIFVPFIKTECISIITTSKIDLSMKASSLMNSYICVCRKITI